MDISTFIGLCGSLKEIISKNKDFKQHLDDSYQRALKRWCKNDAIRASYSSRMFANIENLLNYLKNPEQILPKSNELISLWAEELRNDESCYHFILENKIDESLIQEHQTQNLILEVKDTVEAHTNSLNTIVNQNDSIINILAATYSSIPRGRKEHNQVPRYIRRFCRSCEEKEDDLSLFLESNSRHTLAEYVIGVVGTVNKYILYSGAQSGKTTDLRHLCWELQESDLYLPVYFEVKTCADLQRKDLPYVQHVEGREVVVIIDALDEINGQQRKDLLKVIQAYAFDHPKMKMVLSCRNNYRKEEKLDGFYELFLLDLSWEDTCAHITNTLGESSSLIAQIKEQGLYEFAQQPFFLNILIEASKRKKSLPKSRTELYRLFIESSYRLEKEEKETLERYQPNLDAAKRLLERVALAMSLMNHQYLTEEDFNRCLDDDRYQIEECKRYEIIHFEDGQYTFKHNAFREWLVADYLYRKGLEEARKLAVYPNGKIKPGWYNIIVLWLSFYGKEEKKEVEEIVAWLEKACLELIVYADCDVLPETTKNKIFSDILLQYKNLGMRIYHFCSHEYADLMKFGQSVETVRFLIGEIRQTDVRSVYFGDLMSICYHLNWRLLKLKSRELFNELLQVLEEKVKGVLEKGERKPSDDLLVFIFWENPFFAKEECVQRAFNILKDSTDYQAIKTMLHLIEATGLGDDYIDYILDKEDFVHDQHDGYTSYSVSRDVVYRSLMTVTSKEGIRRILQHCFGNPHRFYRSEWRNYSNLIHHCLQKVSLWIRSGDASFIPVVEESYSCHFGDRYQSYTHEINVEKLLQDFRCLYRETGLAETEKVRFDEVARKLSTEGGKREEVELLFRKTGLWLTEELLNQYYEGFQKDNLSDNILASWFTLCPIADLSEMAGRKHDEFFPESENLRKMGERRKAAFENFSNYELFKQEVLEALGKVVDSRRKELRKQLIEGADERVNVYVYRFFLNFIDSDELLDESLLIRSIKDRQTYDYFFMLEVSDLIIYNEQQGELTEEARIRCLYLAHSILMDYEYQSFPDPCIRKAVRLFLDGYFTIDADKLVGLIDYATVSTSRYDESKYCIDYTLFDYMKEHLSVDQLSGPVLGLFKRKDQIFSSWEYNPFAAYLIENRVSASYDVLLEWIVREKDPEIDFAEMMIKEGIMIPELKAASECMKPADRLRVYACLKEYQQEEEWVKENLERELSELEGYDLKKSISMLLTLGSLDALEYVADHLSLFDTGEEFHFHYDDVKATSFLVEVLAYVQKRKAFDPFTGTSIINSLQNIATKSLENLLAVKDSLGKLINSDEDYKYLNRHLMQFENKFYEMNTPYHTIDEVIIQIDGENLMLT